MVARTARAPRPTRSAPPPLPPMAALDRTHHDMMQVLVDLRHLVEHLADEGVDATARSGAKAICQFFTGHARQHHADEEALVFPALLLGALVYVILLVFAPERAAALRARFGGA